MFEDLQDDEFTDEEFADETEEGDDGEGSNRIFLIALAVLSILVFLGVICGGFLFWRNSQSGERTAQETQNAEINAQNTMVAEAAGQTQVALSWTDTPTVTPVPSQTPTPTSVVILPTATSGEATVNPATATIAALLTQAASQPTLDPGVTITVFPTPTGLPNTGFFDDYGVAGLITLTLAAIAIIFLARRLRTADR
jgi:cytoskeletal protein RodZ